MTKKFILGVGAQKCGTSWLHNYLQNRPDVDTGFAKEYHIFDALTVPECAEFRTNVENHVAELLKQDGQIWKNEPDVQRLSFMADPQSYFAYFADLLSADSISATADITPSYSALSAETLTFIRDEFRKREIEVFPIFLMRDPVERLRSMVKMQLMRNNPTPTQEEILEGMRHNCGAPGDNIRSNYARTIRCLTDAFGEHKYLGFYESLFSEDSVRSICKFIGIPYEPADFQTRINESPSPHKLKAEDRAAFANHYDAQYAFLYDLYGEEHVRSIWKT